MFLRYLLILVIFFGLSTWVEARQNSKTGTKEITDFQEVGEEEDSVEEEAEKKPVLGENEELLSGRVSVIRKLGSTEVFFKDLKDSYYIPSGAKNYSIYKAFEASSKKGNKVHFKANKKSRQVISLEDEGSASKNSGSK